MTADIFQFLFYMSLLEIPGKCTISSVPIQQLRLAIPCIPYSQDAILTNASCLTNSLFGSPNYSIVSLVLQMSLFKARDWWNAQVGHDETFDLGCLVVGNISNVDSITAIGELTHPARVYGNVCQIFRA